MQLNKQVFSEEKEMVAKGVGASSLVPSESILVQMTEVEDFYMENITNHNKMGSSAASS